MPDIAPSIPVAGQPNSTEEPKIVTALTQLVATVNALDGDNISDTVAAYLGLSNSSGVRRGKTITTTTETRTNTAYGLMTTPDRVSSVVLPTDGLICVAYQATWQESVALTASAAIFLGTNQLKLASSGLAAPPVQEVGIQSATVASRDAVLATSSVGLISQQYTAAYTGDVTTGQVVGQIGTAANGGGAVSVFAAAGTYDVSVQFKSTSGTVTVKNRKLWVWTLGF